MNTNDYISFHDKIIAPLITTIVSIDDSNSRSILKNQLQIIENGIFDMMSPENKEDHRVIDAREYIYRRLSYC